MAAIMLQGLTSKHLRSAMGQGVVIGSSAIPKSLMSSPALTKPATFHNTQWTPMDTSPFLGHAQYSVFSEHEDMDTTPASAFSYAQYSIFAEHSAMDMEDMEVDMCDSQPPLQQQPMLQQPMMQQLQQQPQQLQQQPQKQEEEEKLPTADDICDILFATLKEKPKREIDMAALFAGKWH